jgi:hypothetical protein
LGLFSRYSRKLVNWAITAFSEYPENVNGTAVSLLGLGSTISVFGGV